MPEVSSQILEKPLILKRQWVVFFTCCASFIMFLLRYNLSVAIISILEEKELVLLVRDFNKSNVSSTDNEIDQVQIYRRKYPLTDSMVTQILASYFYSYTIFQLPSGRLSELFGAKWLLGFGTLLSGILSFISPFMLDLSPIALIICRMLIGMLHSSILSCSYTLFAVWLPNKQKAKSITLLNIGFEIGGICSLFLTGYICSMDSLGWRYSFYLFSFICLVWFIPYCFIVHSKPEDDLSLTDYEKKLFERERFVDENHQDLTDLNKIKIPPKLDYKILLTSKPVIASCLAKSSLALAYYVITIKMPAYLHDVFNVSIRSNGTLTASTFAGSMVAKIICFLVSSYLINLKLMSLTNLRKTFQTIAMLVPSICFVIITSNNDDQTLVIFLIIFSMFSMGFLCLGDAPMTAEFAKDLSGSVFGFTNTFSCLAAAFSPLLVNICQNMFANVLLAWNCVFYITASYLLISAVYFIFNATSEPQRWAENKFVSVDELKSFSNKELNC